MDLELKKAFTEMQMNKIETSKKMRSLDINSENFRVSKQRLELTNVEVSKLDPETKVYASVGRMFVLSKVPELSEELKNKQIMFGEMIETCDKNKEFLLKSLKEQEDSLRELVQQRKDADAAAK